MGSQQQIILAEGAGLNVTRIYTTGVSQNETIPSNCSVVYLECWGGGGAGGGAGSVAASGGGGGSGGLCFSSYPLTSANWGQTIKYTVGAGGTAVAGNNDGNVGSLSTQFSGTFTITAMSAFQGSGGKSQANGSTGGAGAGTSTGGNLANLGGNSGTNGGFCVIGQPGASVPGKLFSDNQASGLYGAGSTGHSTGAGTNGTAGACVFYYQ
jgi:hypothetical protein